MNKIKIAIVGIGNCASSLIQGIEYYKHKEPEEAIGLMHWDIGGYTPRDIAVVAAFDFDERKAGKDVHLTVLPDEHVRPGMRVVVSVQKKRKSFPKLRMFTKN